MGRLERDRRGGDAVVGDQGHLPAPEHGDERAIAADRDVAGRGVADAFYRDGRVRDAITIHHPLQPFDPRNFIPGALTAAGPFSFDETTLEGARALVAPRIERPPLLEAPLPPLASKLLELGDLVRFVQHPARAFLRQRLGVTVGDFSDEFDSALPLELDGLQQWAIGDRMLLSRLAGRSMEVAVAGERARGALPPGRLAEDELATLQANVEAVAAAATTELSRTTHLSSLDTRAVIPGRGTLSGTVAGLCDDRMQFVTYSRVGPKHRLAAWVRLLALTIAWPNRPFEAVTIGRASRDAPSRAKVTILRIPPLADTADGRRATALRCLEVLLDLFDRGMREPAPLACATSAAFAHAADKDRNAAAAGRKAWTTDWGYPNEDKDPEHMQLFGGVIPFERLISEPPRDDETGPGWDDEQSSRFGRWAVRLWAELIAAEEVTDR